MATSPAGSGWVKPIFRPPGGRESGFTQRATTQPRAPGDPTVTGPRCAPRSHLGRPMTADPPPRPHRAGHRRRPRWAGRAGRSRAFRPDDGRGFNHYRGWGGERASRAPPPGCSAVKPLVRTLGDTEGRFHPAGCPGRPIAPPLASSAPGGSRTCWGGEWPASPSPSLPKPRLGAESAFGRRRIAIGPPARSRAPPRRAR